jgi:hypothetical protein
MTKVQAKFLNVISDVNAAVAQQLVSSPDTLKVLQGLLNEDTIRIFSIVSHCL